MKIQSLATVSRLHSSTYLVKHVEYRVITKKNQTVTLQLRAQHECSTSSRFIRALSKQL